MPLIKIFQRTWKKNNIYWRVGQLYKLPRKHQNQISTTLISRILQINYTNQERPKAEPSDSHIQLIYQRTVISNSLSQSNCTNNLQFEKQSADTSWSINFIFACSHLDMQSNISFVSTNASSITK